MQKASARFRAIAPFGDRLPHKVRIGRMRGDYVSVEAGLKAGDKVASSGLFKLRNGVNVLENNELTPKTEKSPKPANT